MPSCYRMCKSWHCTEGATPLQGAPALSPSSSVLEAQLDVVPSFQRWSSVRTEVGMAWMYKWGAILSCWVSFLQHLDVCFCPMRQIRVMLELSDPWWTVYKNQDISDSMGVIKGRGFILKNADWWNTYTFTTHHVSAIQALNVIFTLWKLFLCSDYQEVFPWSINLL